MSSLHILWDESHIWGLLAWRAIRALGLPHRLVRGQEIAQGLLSRKPPAALVVPGGVARRKAERLGAAGMQAIRDYIELGGTYIGFCGGSGLGLTGAFGLKICPWQRAAMKDRMLHLVSGHLHCDVNRSHPLIPENLPESPLLPVWWPARFATQHDSPVSVLATYAAPGPDFWVADISLETLPGDALADWETLYGVRLQPSNMAGQPCMVTGEYGEGNYLLSYAHLETPESPHANAWFAHILSTVLGAETPAHTTIAPWDLDALPTCWDDPLLLEAKEVLDGLIALGRDHFLLFERNPWLLGWRAGLPGAALNNIYSLLRQLLAIPPSDEARSWLADSSIPFAQALHDLHHGATGYLLAERLAMTLAKTFPDAVDQAALKRQREVLFGHPMEHGGPYGFLLDTLDQLFWLCIKGREEQVTPQPCICPPQQEAVS